MTSRHASADLFDHLDQLGVEDAVAAARFANLPMVQVDATNLTDSRVFKLKRRPINLCRIMTAIVSLPAESIPTMRKYSTDINVNAVSTKLNTSILR